MRFQFIVIGLSFLIVSCSSEKQVEYIAYKEFDTIQFIQTSSIRGVDVLNDSVVWLSGNKGFFARSVNGGKDWNSRVVNLDSLLDFRDIHAFSEKSAYVMSADSPARFYKTVDGGITWRLTYENTHPDIFFNSIEFWDTERGMACGDPIDGEFQILTTNNGGETWIQVDQSNLPKSLDNEGGFAASGTCISLGANGLALYALGGDTTRILRSEDAGQTWEPIITPFISGAGGFGIYSIANVNDSVFVAIGGHWQYNKQAEKNYIVSTDYGKSWSLGESMPNGFRSCVRIGLKSGTIITSGRNGVDISTNKGKTWDATDLPPFYTFDVSESEELIVFAGAKGKVAIRNKNK